MVWHLGFDSALGAAFLACASRPTQGKAKQGLLFAKRSKKLFSVLSRTQRIKVFCSFFAKKECLPSPCFIALAFGACDGTASLIGSDVPMAARLACMLLAAAAMFRRARTALVLLVCSADNLFTGNPHDALADALGSAAMAAAGLVAVWLWQAWVHEAQRPPAFA